MSTLNRALAKIYGRTDTSAPFGESDKSEAAECPANKNTDGLAHAEHKQFEEPPRSAADADQDMPAVGGDATTAKVYDGGNRTTEFQSLPVLELPSTSHRIDGPSSNIVEPPHLALAQFDATVSQEPPIPDSHEDGGPSDTSESAVTGAAGSDHGTQSEVSAKKSEESADPSPSESQGVATSQEPAFALSPEWEVDRFRWPETCQQLLLEKDEAFESAIESLVGTSTRGRMTVALVSENSGDGASTTALCIARQAAQLGRNVLLVDADVSAPALATLVGLNTPCSWHDSVTGDVPLAESLVVSVEDRLCLMPLHADCEQSTLKLSDQRVEALLEKVSQAYDLVVLDCGSTERLSERIENGGRLPCDVAVIVRNASGQQESDPAKAPQWLQSLGVRNTLFVENFVHDPKPAGDKVQSSAA